MAPKSRRQSWRSLFALAFGNMIDTADGGLINALFPAIRQALGLNLEALGLLTAVSRIARMVFGPLWAWAGDRWDRKALMFVVTGVWGVWTVLAGFAQNEVQLMILYAIGAVGIVAAEPLSASITADLFPADERGKAFGALRGIGGIGFVVFTPIIGFISQNPEGWRWAMWGMGGLSILSGILILIFLQDPGRGASEGLHLTDDRIHKGDLGWLLRNPSMWVLSVSMLFVTSLVLLSFSVTFLVDVRGFTNAEGTYVLAMFAVGYLCSSFLGGFIGDRCHKRWGFAGRIGFMQVYLLVYAAASFVCLQIGWPHQVYYPLFFFFGLLSSLGFPAAVLPIASAVVLPEARSTAFGILFSFIQGAVTAALSLLVGILAERFGLLVVVFWATTVPYTLNAILWFALYKTVPISLRQVEKSLRDREQNQTAT